MFLPAPRAPAGSGVPVIPPIHRGRGLPRGILSCPTQVADPALLLIMPRVGGVERMEERVWSGVQSQRVLLTLACFAAAALCACGKPTAEEVQKSLQERLISAKTGDVVELPAGKFHFDRTLSLT